ncbi:flagellar hook-associated protein FlgK [Paenibacillus abyssi]|uniref:Flagellar hook-associated protein 1 n=1 Tax=Paenibacillus abyssi TaxID=1340531 RepID=A0A917FMH7_9BACL|nr:flagellar hook-associated protein FlgK [Paenibacillus abyssi]GGF91535.1 flagellar hook-associated protein 1 [Paenibacillus abyssi]
MRSTFHGIEVAKRSLFTQQAALSTTGHNIANANTAGYSRQVVNMVAARPLEGYGLMRSTIPGQTGMGVEFDSITRIREKFIDDQFRNENKNFGNYTIQQDTLEKLEKIVNEPSDTGIRTVISEFFNAWSDLSKAPENADGRKIVREQALALTDAFNHTARSLEDLKIDLTENVDIRVVEMNSILRNIGQLNNEILRIEGLGDDANDLRDQRDLMTDELSKMVNIRVEDLSTGYQITMGGTTLLQGFVPVPVDRDLIEGAFASGDLNSGEVFGMITSRDRYVQGYIDDLNSLANTLANGEFVVTIPAGSVLPDGTEVDGVVYSGTVADRTLSSDLTATVKGLNGLHQLGYNFSSDPVGLPFFTDSTGGSGNLTALNITLNKELADNPTKIAASMRVTDESGTEEVVKGNNTLAVLFSQARDFRFNFGTSTETNMNTIDSYFRSIVGELGVQAREANRQLANSKTLIDQVDARRQSVSGVSLDEEMANMIKFQHAYNAAARNMTVIDETLDRIINSMGIVGR